MSLLFRASSHLALDLFKIFVHIGKSGSFYKVISAQFLNANTMLLERRYATSVSLILGLNSRFRLSGFFFSYSFQMEVAYYVDTNYLESLKGAKHTTNNRVISRVRCALGVFDSYPGGRPKANCHEN